MDREALKLLVDLISQLTGMANDEAACLALNRLQLVKDRDDKDGSLAHTALGLAHDVSANQSLRNALLLH